jgi:hypothetical protein
VVITCSWALRRAIAGQLIVLGSFEKKVGGGVEVGIDPFWWDALAPRRTLALAEFDLPDIQLAQPLRSKIRTKEIG